MYILFNFRCYSIEIFRQKLFCSTTMSKENKISSLISKVGTFRGKKSHQNNHQQSFFHRPSASDLKSTESNSDESMFKSNSDDNTGSLFSESSELDTTSKSFSGTGSYRFIFTL